VESASCDRWVALSDIKIPRIDAIGCLKVLGETPLRIEIIGRTAFGSVFLLADTDMDMVIDRRNFMMVISQTEGEECEDDVRTCSVSDSSPFVSNNDTDVLISNSK
jgi:hypothetical protein